MGTVSSFRTRAAEGLDRRGFSIAEIEAMIAAGVLDDDEKFELIEGEIVPMGPQALPHVLMKGAIGRALVTACPPEIWVVQDATLLLDGKSFFEPDVLVFRPNREHRYVEPEDVLLAVEVADTSRVRDLVTKPPRYGTAGVTEMWVVELNEQRTYVFRRPGTADWTQPVQVPFSSDLAPLFLPDVRIRLSDLA